jgi:hypothetical protein
VTVTAEELHRLKIERETRETLLVIQATKAAVNKVLERTELTAKTSNDTLEHARRAEDNAREAAHSAKNAEAAATRSQLASERVELQVGYCRNDVSQLQGEVSSIHLKLDELLTQLANLNRLVPAQPAASAVVEDAAAAGARGAE